MALAALPASASADGWTQQAIPPAPSSPNGSLNAISCPTTTSCVAVGGYVNNSGESTSYAQILGGTTWTTHGLSAPANGSGLDLTAISCAAADSCMAVGRYTNASNVTTPVAELWNGSTWTIEQPASEDDATYSGVSCAGQSLCTIVGSYDGSESQQPLAEQWDGSSWTVQSVPSTNVLSAISCPASNSCTATGEVGQYNNTTVIDTWDGWEWTSTTPPQPSYPALPTISCSAANYCVAVGGGSSEIGSGSNWTLGTVPNGNLSSVSCAPDTEQCTAVGFNENAIRNFSTAAEAWNGDESSWAEESTDNPSVPNNVLSDVSCPTSSACVAVGGASGHTALAPGVGPSSLPITEISQGSGFTSAEPNPAPLGVTPASLDSVSCSSKFVCMAVGSAGAQPGSPFAEFWNGATWTVEQMATVPGAVGQFNGVSCVKSTCVAVGEEEDGVWGRNGWSVQTTDGLGNQLPELLGVSCPSSSHCIAVGEQVAEVWNATDWTALPSPTGDLASVSCTGANHCVAVGGDIEIWNGSAWSEQLFPQPSGSEGVYFRSVSCSSANACTAGGYYDTATGESPLTERWNGSRWSIETDATGLSGVSCPVSNSCAGVTGDYAENWNGSTWTSHAIGTQGNLNAVSCIAATACTAVGTTTGAVAEPYVEIYSQPATSTTTGPTPGSPGPTVGSPGAPSTSQIKAALKRILFPHGRAARVRQLLRHGGYTFVFDEPVAGRLVLSWRVRSRHREVVIARLTIIRAGAGKAKLKLKLTKSGRDLLRHSRRLSTAARGSFTPRNGPAVSVQKRFWIAG